MAGPVGDPDILHAPSAFSRYIRLIMDSQDGYFDAEVAAGYDDPAGAMNQPAAIEPVVDVLAELAGDGRALELAIGTGRIAVPLAGRGVEVHGIELSRAMVEQLRRKPGAESIEVAIGDMTSTRLEGSFRVAYLVFNTIGNLTTQDAQVACFANAAAHLEPGGTFVIEVGIPDLRRLPPGQDAVPFTVTAERLGFDTYDVATQAMTSHHVTFTGGAPKHFSVPFRYVWPSELDLMARLAGMRLRDRWESWDGRPFSSDSTSHVSVWEKIG
jgi:SAM-dependent methyltransferase